MAQRIKNPPAMQGTEETWVRSPARGGLRRRGVAAAPVPFLVWEVLWMEEPGLQSPGSAESQTRLSSWHTPKTPS